MGRPTGNRVARFDTAPAFVMASCGPVSLTLPREGRTGVRHMHASGARAACVYRRGGNAASGHRLMRSLAVSVRSTTWLTTAPRVWLWLRA